MKVEYRLFIVLFGTAFCLLYLYLLFTHGIYLLKYDPYASDFLAFYTGTQLLSLSPMHLYNLHSQIVLQQQIDPLTKFHDAFILFDYPPFVAFLFKPLFIFGLVNSYSIFFCINILLLFLFCILSLKQIRIIPWYYSLAFIVSIITFSPLLITLVSGQMSIILCLIFLGIWLSLKRGKEFQSGILLSLLLIKPHFFVLPFIVLLIQGRKKLIAGLIVGVLLLFGISLYSVGWNGLMNYLSLLSFLFQTGTRLNLMAQQSLQTLLIIIFSTKSLTLIHIFWLFLIAIFAVITLFVWLKKYPFNSGKFAMQFSLLIIATLFTSPHTHFYDLSFLLVPSVILLSQMESFPKRQKKLFIACIIFNYIIPWIGYWILVWLKYSLWDIWVVPTVVYLVIFYLVLCKELNIQLPFVILPKNQMRTKH